MAIHSQEETTRSAPHRRVERILDQMQISYESEVAFHPFSIDIYLGEFHAGLEIDGPSHSPKKDAARDARLLNEYFLPIMHIPAELVRSDIEAPVISFLEAVAGSAAERRKAFNER